jgi:hypothetical protein
MITIDPWYLMMQRLGAEMAGFSGGAGEYFPKWAGYKSQAFFEGEVSGCTLSRSGSPQKTALTIEFQSCYLPKP